MTVVVPSLPADTYCHTNLCLPQHQSPRIGVESLSLWIRELAGTCKSAAARRSTHAPIIVVSISIIRIANISEIVNTTSLEPCKHELAADCAAAAAGAAAPTANFIAMMTRDRSVFFFRYRCLFRAALFSLSHHRLGLCSLLSRESDIQDTRGLSGHFKVAALAKPPNIGKLLRQSGPRPRSK